MDKQLRRNSGRLEARMGHSSINVTLDRYGHLLPECQGFFHQLDL